MDQYSKTPKKSSSENIFFSITIENIGTTMCNYNEQSPAAPYEKDKPRLLVSQIQILAIAKIIKNPLLGTGPPGTGTLLVRHQSITFPN
jgi:hypothetical protein